MRSITINDFELGARLDGVVCRAIAIAMENHKRVWFEFASIDFRVGPRSTPLGAIRRFERVCKAKYGTVYRTNKHIISSGKQADYSDRLLGKDKAEEREARRINKRAKELLQSLRNSRRLGPH